MVEGKSPEGVAHATWSGNLVLSRRSNRARREGPQPVRGIKLAFLCVLIAGGCSTASVDPENGIGIQWVIPDETTPCPEIRGHLAIASLLDIRRRTSRAFHDELDRVEADFARRCPREGDVALEVHAVSFADHHCAYLRGLLTTIAAFDMTGALTDDEWAVADLLAVEVEAEIDSRCD